MAIIDLQPAKEQAMALTMLHTMQAVAIDRFGGVETMSVRTLPVPEVGPDEILVRVDCAGVGAWDPFEREGGFAEEFHVEPRFPYVLGSEGSGTVVAVGEKVDRFAEGDRVWAIAFMSPKGGFYAEYVAVRADDACRIPEKLTTEQAGVMPIDAITALRGLDDTLGLQRGESLIVVGASGGIGHLAIQLAQRMGARVLAVASHDDGVALAERLGAEAVVEGHTGDIPAAARAFAPGGIDTALLTAGGEAAEQALAVLRAGGRAAYPHGVEPEPKGGPGVTVRGYDGMPDREAIDKLDRLIGAGPFDVHVARTFALDQAGEAHRFLGQHHLGKLALRPS
jgi:NADPH:quinone reductase-like Zn-dependent oxidoreductase